MSSVINFPLEVTLSNKTQYYTVSGSASISASDTLGVVTASRGEGYVALNNAAKEKIFPNSTAHPKRITVSWHHYQSATGSNPTPYTSLEIAGTEVKKQSNNTSIAVNYDSSDSTFLNTINKSSVIRFHIQNYYWFLIGGWTSLGGAEGHQFNFYFTRYDFSSSISDGINSASVSSSNGYDGDSVTFTASVQNGYTWDGWYNGSTKVSSSQTYAHTVAGADMALTAKAIASSKTVTTKYGTTTIATEQRMPPVAVNYGSTQIASISSGETKTLNCSDNLMSSNLTVGGKTLLCANQIMNGNIIVSVS